MSDIPPVRSSFFIPALFRVDGSADQPLSTWRTTLFSVGIFAGIFFAFKWLQKPSPSLPKVAPESEDSSKKKTQKVGEKEIHQQERASSPPPIDRAEHVDTSDDEKDAAASKTPPRSPQSLPKAPPESENSSKKKTQQVSEDEIHQQERAPSPAINQVDQVDGSNDEEEIHTTPKVSPRSPRSPRSPFSPGGVHYDSPSIGWGSMQSHQSPAKYPNQKRLFDSGHDSGSG